MKLEPWLRYGRYLPISATVACAIALVLDPADRPLLHRFIDFTTVLVCWWAWEALWAYSREKGW